MRQVIFNMVRTIVRLAVIYRPLRFVCERFLQRLDTEEHLKCGRCCCEHFAACSLQVDVEDLSPAKYPLKLPCSARIFFLRVYFLLTLFLPDVRSPYVSICFGFQARSSHGDDARSDVAQAGGDRG